ncbi:MAG: undecaprenyldiphospho-muramoylpentapeptide beta-N-acetylglucosaminyltransferase, partial [Oscillospiraceae bacterium]|nr:undecaprenyldiphospho-muramoylpentapeptide beta-N-acetylglucosaminyltransferase [Oscillospiraceae bacterium]
MKILFVAGGTGGHINPAIAVASEIKRLYPTTAILFVGTKNRMETKIVPAAGFPIKTVEMSGFSRKLSVSGIKSNVKTAYLAVKASADAKKIIQDFSPDAVVGFGGYVTGPVLRAAARMKIPTCIHEQNAFPGVANKALAKMVDRVMLTSPEAEKYMKCKNTPVITGLPVRRQILQADKSFARAALGIKPNEMLVLSMGGSLGAREINNAVIGMLSELHTEKDIKFIHAAGQYGGFVWDELKEKGIPFGKNTNIDLREYINDMDICLSACDLVISRAGASSISEISALGKPSILIPSPNVAENHQFHNANTLASNGGAILIEEKDLTPELLAQTVKELKDNRKRLAEISVKAPEKAKT